MGVPSRFLIYALVDPRDGAIRYVGRSSSGLQRAQAHSTASHKIRNDHCHRWVAALARDGLKPGISILEELSESVDVDALLNIRERWWIAEFRRRGARLTNLTDGGEGQLGRRLSEESRRKISLAQQGKKRDPCSEERRRRISEARRGRPQPPSVIAALVGRTLSPEAKLKISVANTGRKPSVEARLKMSLAKIGGKKSAETRYRMSLAKKGTGGWRHTEEARRKISESNQRRWAKRKAVVG